MGIEISFNQSEKHDPVSIFKEDAVKYDAIKKKLCEKRKLLEVAMQSPDMAVREQSALDLIQLKESMNIIGISEIDYQAYLEQENSQDQVLPIFA